MKFESVNAAEKAFNSALSLSITKILICMACLAFLTWAWYSIDLANGSTMAHNVLELAVLAVGGGDLPHGLSCVRSFWRL